MASRARAAGWLCVQVCLKMINEHGANGRSKAADWKARMSKRIVECDELHARKRKLGA